MKCVRCSAEGVLTVRDDDGHSRLSCLECLALVVGQFMLDCKAFRVELVATDSSGLLR